MRKLTITLCLSFAVLLGSIGSSSALHPCPSEEEFWNNCFGTYVWADGRKYVGEWKRGVKHGQGINTSANGTITEGVWEKGKFKAACSFVLEVIRT